MIKYLEMYTSTPCFVSIESEKVRQTFKRWRKMICIYLPVFLEKRRRYRFLYNRDFRHETVKTPFAITFEELETII